MAKTFNINGIDYVAREFDFNLICDFEDMGVSIDGIGEKPMSLVRAYFTLCSGLPKDMAGLEIEKHIIAGGNFDDVMDIISDKLENSGFFQNLSKTTEKKNTKNQK